MKIACMGDSITYGMGLEDDLTRRWTDLAETMTGDTWLNFGISGDTTGGMLVRIHTDVIPARPDVMFLLGGVNDISNISDSAFDIPKLNMIAMRRHLMRANIPIVLCTLLPTVCEDLVHAAWDYTRDNERSYRGVEAYSEWLKAYAASQEIPVCDFRSGFFDANGNVRRDLFIDGLHPNAEGHKVMAEIAAACAKNLKF